MRTAILIGVVTTIACEVPVADPSSTIGRLLLSPQTSTLRAGQTTQFTVVALTQTGDTAVALLTGRVVTWASGNTGLATVTGHGLVTGVTTGSVTITATSEGIDGIASVTVTAPPPPGGTWPNEPAGYTAVPELAFSASISGTGDYALENGWRVNNWRSPALVSRVSDATAPLGPPYVGQFAYPQGFGSGAEPGMVYHSAGGTKDHYVGYWFKYSNPYSNQAVGTKQWYPHSANSNYYVLYTSSGKMQLTVQGDGSHGGIYNLPANVNNPTVTLGVWHQMEVYQKYPSNSSTNDGILRWWLDGVLCGNYTNVGWTTSSTYDEWRLAPTWGGLGGSAGFDSYWWVDHVHISQP